MKCECCGVDLVKKQIVLAIAMSPQALCKECSEENFDESIVTVSTRSVSTLYELANLKISVFQIETSLKLKQLIKHVPKKKKEEKMEEEAKELNTDYPAQQLPTNPYPENRQRSRPNSFPSYHLGLPY